jgi:hypothetical protein
MKYIKSKYIFESNTYYNSHGATMYVSEFIEIEVEERENYELSDVYEWMLKYNFDETNECIWVTKDKRDAYKYILSAEYYDKIENNENIDKLISDSEVYEYTDSDGQIIEESDDGDGGFLLIINK